MKADNSNSIYEDLNKEPLSVEVLNRINLFKDIVNPFIKEGFTIDLCCGTKEIGILFEADDFYDYFISEDIKKCDMLNFGNNVETKGDNILFTHAIEHFADVKQTLDIIRQEFIQDKGRLIITCPNSDYDNKHKPFDRSIGHYSYHNVQSIKNIAPKCGFRILFVGEINYYKDYEELVVVLEAI